MQRLDATFVTPCLLTRVVFTLGCIYSAFTHSKDELVDYYKQHPEQDPKNFDASSESSYASSNKRTKVEATD